MSSDGDEHADSKTNGSSMYKSLNSIEYVLVDDFNSYAYIVEWAVVFVNFNFVDFA